MAKSCQPEVAARLSSNDLGVGQEVTGTSGRLGPVGRVDHPRSGHDSQPRDGRHETGAGHANEALEPRLSELGGGARQQGGETAGEGMEKPNAEGDMDQYPELSALRLIGRSFLVVLPLVVPSGFCGCARDARDAHGAKTPRRGPDLCAAAPAGRGSDRQFATPLDALAVADAAQAIRRRRVALSCPCRSGFCRRCW